MRHAQAPEMARTDAQVLVTTRVKWVAWGKRIVKSGPFRDAEDHATGDTSPGTGRRR